MYWEEQGGTGQIVNFIEVINYEESLYFEYRYFGAYE